MPAMREFTLPVGTDLIAAALSGTDIAGIRVDNPSGSWLRVTGIEQYVPPYTAGWTTPVVPNAASISVLFAASPSGTPSAEVGEPVTVTLYDISIGSSPGYPTGAQEIQQSGIGNDETRVFIFRIDETTDPSIAQLTLPDGYRLGLLSWQVSVHPIFDTYTGLRAECMVFAVNGIGEDQFPPAIISPSHPTNPWTPAIGRQMEGALDIGGGVAAGGGATDVIVYIRYYPIAVSE